jgi:hypothetical protein
VLPVCFRFIFPGSCLQFLCAYNTFLACTETFPSVMLLWQRVVQNAPVRISMYAEETDIFTVPLNGTSSCSCNSKELTHLGSTRFPGYTRSSEWKYEYRVYRAQRASPAVGHTFSPVACFVYMRFGDVPNGWAVLCLLHSQHGACCVTQGHISAISSFLQL